MNLETYIKAAKRPTRSRYRGTQRERDQAKRDRLKALEKVGPDRAEHFKRWDEVSEALVMASTETDVELAKRMGRTLDSVRSKRRKLNKVHGIVGRPSLMDTLEGKS